MKLPLFFLVCLFVMTNVACAQNFEYGKITVKDIALKNPGIDSNANAVVIREFGTAAMHLKSLEINQGSGGKLIISFDYHVKIKIFNKNGFKAGTVIIPRKVYREGEADEILEVAGATYNFVDGNLQKFELDKKDVIDEKIDKLNSVTKFTLPNLSDGSIIEYTYRLNKPYLLNFKGWNFQSDIPKLYSQFIAYIPTIYNYNISLRGDRKLDSTKTDRYTGCIRIFGQPYDCTRVMYTMKNIPAFAEEENMGAAENFRSAIRYELSDYFDPRRLERKYLTKTWKDVDHELAEADYFGGQIKRTNTFEKLMPEILNNATDSMGKANAVYSYIRKNISPNGLNDIFGDNNIRRALLEHSGSMSEINLALVTALKASGLDADALILSTRNNGIVSDFYPVLSEFNYVVAKLNIGKETYLLDASYPRLPFGLLPPQCINGKGRVINSKKPSYWFDIKASQKDFTMYALDAELTPEGKIKGRLTMSSSGYAALYKRERIASANSADEFVKRLDEQMSSISIRKHHISNIDSLDESLIEDYEIEMNAFERTDSKSIFNPFFINRVNENPCNLKERHYPLNLSSASEIRVSARVKLPDNFEISSHPKDLSIALADNGGKYIFNTVPEKGTFTYSEVFQLNKPVYLPDDYSALKEFYGRIIELQKNNVILNH